VALTIHKESGGLVAQETLCATRDGRVVPYDDPQANEVIAFAGRPIPEKIAARYGLKANAKADTAAEPKPVEAEQPKALGEGLPTVTRRPLVSPKGK
jgi:hypothetical protein